jgi:DNA-binding MarR family transcriptional regulator
VCGRCGMEVVYVTDAISSYDRKRLIEHKVPFVLPGNQMYLPFMAINFREYLKTRRIKRPALRPATQLLVLHVLYQGEKLTFTPAEVASILKVSAMTMTRAFDELAALGIGEHTVVGKNRCLRFAMNRKELWEQVRTYLKTPVKKSVYVKGLNLKTALCAGHTALAHWSMINEPENKTVAVSYNDWKDMAEKDRVSVIPAPERGAVEVEIWKYPPDRFSHDGCADKISVYLSLKDSHDERVQSALDDLLRSFKW